MSSYKYSIKKEFTKILQYQTNIINFIEKNKNSNFQNYKAFKIPNEQFVSNWIKILNEHFSFSENLWNNISDIPEPDSINESEKFFKINPIINNKIYSPYILLLAFINKITNDLKNIFDNEIRQLLHGQLEREVLTSILEVVPHAAIFCDFKIEKINERFEFGFIFDNYFFVFKLIEETFTQENLNLQIQSIQKNFLDIKNLSKEKYEIKYANLSQILNEKLNPIFLIIIDNLEDKSFSFKNEVGNNFIILTYHCLQHIFEDLADNNRMLTYFSKLIEKHYLFRPFTFDFCNFYGFFTYGRKFSEVSIGGHSAKFIDPHLWNEEQRKIILKKRPMIDLRPPDYENPYTFKILKLFDYTFYGYNKILNHDFYCYKNGIEIYILADQNKFKSYEDNNFIPFLFEFFAFYFEEFLNEKSIGEVSKNKVILEIIPKDWALKNKILETEPPIPLLIGTDQNNNYLIILDPINFETLFNISPKEVLRYFIDTVIKGIVNDTQFIIINKKFENIDPSKSFKISKVSTISNFRGTKLCFPTDLDFYDIDFDLFKNFKNKIPSGIYEGDEAKKFINYAYEYLVKNLLERIQKYDILKFVILGYSEIENCLKEMKDANLRFRLSQDIKTDYDSLGIIRESQIKLQKYSPACRYLLEQAISKKVYGNENISISEWQNICPVAMKILEFAHMSDYLHQLSDLIDIKIKVQSESGLLFDIIIEDNPLIRQMDYHIKGLRTLDISKFLYQEKNFQDDSDKLYGLLEKSNLKIVNDELEKAFGFRLFHYIIVLNLLTNLQNQENKLSIVTIPLSDAIDFVHNKTNFDKNIISSVIKFSTIFPEGSQGITIEPWRVNTRENRLTIKPIVRIKDIIIFGPEFLIMAEENVVNNIIDGKWLYQRESIPYYLEKALNIRKQEVSDEFEKAVYEEVKKHADFSEINLCKKGKNDKCFVKIKEPCPGEIDVLSIHVEKKTLVLWEVKDIEQKFGSHEIISDIEKFRETKKGFISKTKGKEDYLIHNINSILDYYKIMDEDWKDWKVISCFVLSSDLMAKSILERKLNIINFYDIQKFMGV